MRELDVRQEMEVHIPKGERMIELYNQKGETVDFVEVIKWWLEHYEGLEHLTEGGKTSPETWYTINTILRRCFEKIKKKVR